jgi:serine/arginine repetitive matrix protein 2
MAEPTAADVRAVAVARLKRAASLPRMKDGRRPPMHDDAVSEGDKGNNAEGAMSHSDEATDAEPPPVLVTAQEEGSTAVEEESQISGRDTPSKTKRRGRSRSRSRSRSRGSKDFKEAIAKTNESNRPMDSSPEGQLPPIPFFAPALVSPIPAHFTPMPIHPRAFFSPSSPSPHHFLHSPNSPPPSLDALRAGLIRSNSARLLAMNKLTGRSESPTNVLSSSPSPTPPVLLTRSNTAPGMERSAARNRMFQQLEKRAPAKDGAESDISGGGVEDPGVDSSSTGHSKRASPSLSNAVIDDRDPAPVSPFQTPTPLPAPDVERQSDSTNVNGDDTSERHSPLRRAIPPGPAVHGIVIEEEIDDESVENPLPQSSGLHPNGLPATPPTRKPPTRPQMSESSTSSMSTNTDTERIPVFLHEHGQKSPYTQDTFPVTISPMSTLVRESGIRDEDEGDGDDEKVVFLYPEEMRERKAYLGRLENNISWIGADDGPCHRYQELIEGC